MTRPAFRHEEQMVADDDAAYRELMGDPDEVDVFFVLENRGQQGLYVMRVTGRLDVDQAWVH